MVKASFCNRQGVQFHHMEETVMKASEIYKCKPDVTSMVFM